jgi:hypothetical protein
MNKNHDTAQTRCALYAAVALAFAAALLLTGCPDPNRDDGKVPPAMPAALRGTWTDGTSSLTFTATTIKTTSASDANNWYEYEFWAAAPLTLTEGNAYNDGYTSGYLLIIRTAAWGEGVISNVILGESQTFTFYLNAGKNKFVNHAASGDADAYTKQ